jgi:hypothetical protein
VKNHSKPTKRQKTLDVVKIAVTDPKYTRLRGQKHHKWQKLPIFSELLFFLMTF